VVEWDWKADKKTSENNLPCISDSGNFASLFLCHVRIFQSSAACSQLITGPTQQRLVVSWKCHLPRYTNEAKTTSKYYLLCVFANGCTDSEGWIAIPSTTPVNSAGSPVGLDCFYEVVTCRAFLMQNLLFSDGVVALIERYNLFSRSLGGNRWLYQLIHFVTLANKSGCCAC